MPRPTCDSKLIQIVDAALADAATRAGDWLVCHPGCTPCCHGVFVISALDRARLRDGLAELDMIDPARADALRRRVRSAMDRLSGSFPGNPSTGVLWATEGPAFDAFAEADDAPCPVLSPGTGTCDLYAHRPMTCRVFGPPVCSEGGIGHCELCFQGATEEQILVAEMQLPPSELEDELNAEAEGESPGKTIIAFAFLDLPACRPAR
jgi:Fe-S-cluster containining protein